MSLYQRHGIWHFRFTCGDRIYNRCTETTDVNLAMEMEASCRQDALAEAQRKLPVQMPVPAEYALPTDREPDSITRNITVGEAGRLLVDQKRWRRMKPKTIETTIGYVKNLSAFFAETKLSEIHAGTIREYQDERSKKAGPSQVNHEMVMLGAMLKQAKCWFKIAPYFRPIRQPDWQKPKVFTSEEQQAIFRAAGQDKNFELAKLVFTITRNTSASGTELRLVRIRQLDIDANPPTFHATGDTTKT